MDEEQVFLPEDINIVWFGPERPDDIEAAEAQIRQELYELMDDGSMDVRELIFHTVFLNKDMDKDIVTVAPLEDENTVECIYNKVAEWVSAESQIDGEEIQFINHDDRDTSTKH